MTTLAPQPLRDIIDDLEEMLPSATFSGIVGDYQHSLQGGYHIAIEDQGSGNYSVVRVDDAAPPGDWPRNLASAIDISVALADMKIIDARVEKVFYDHSDPRRKYINAINCWDGNGSPGRFDFVSNELSAASEDHEWHYHAELRRRWANTREGAEGLLSVLRGDTPAQWLAKLDEINAGTPAAPIFQPRLRRAWPSYMPANHYFGLKTGPNASHGGYYASEQADVKAIQQRLGEIGFSAGAVDGDFGPRTKAAVNAWQRVLYSQYTTRYGEVWSDDWQRLFTY